MQDFLDVIFAEATLSESIAFFSFQNHPGAGDKWPTKSERAVTRAAGSAAKHELYMSVSTYTPEPDGYVRRTRGAFTGMHAIPLDDIGTKATAPEGVTPTTIVETSPGNFQWLLALSEPVRDYALASAVIKKLGEMGYTDRGGAMPNKVMRLPCGWNLKPHLSEPWAVRLTELNWDAVHSLEEWAEKLGVGLNNLDVARAQETPSGARQVDSIDNVYAWLSTRLPGMPGSVLSEPNPEGFVDIVCPWHSEHTEGVKQGTGYKLLGLGNTPTSRAFHCFHSHNMKISDFLQWVTAEGGPSCPITEPGPYYQDRFALITDGNRVADMHDSNPDTAIRELNEFKSEYARMFTPQGTKTAIPGHRIWLNDHQRVTLRSQTFDPRRESRIVDLNGQKHYNTYRAPYHREVSGEPSIFLDHIEYLIPNDSEYEHYLDWLAYKVQNPESRSHSVFMIAPETYGTGRSWLGDMMRALFRGCSCNVSFPELMGHGSQGAFNAWAAGNLMINVDEVKDLSGGDAGSKYDSYDHFKHMVDVRPVEMNIAIKYGKNYRDRVWFVIQAFSNHTDAMIIPGADRRIFATYNPTWFQEPKYYERLYGALDNDTEAARVWWWLKARDVSNFNVGACPPMTSAKRDMISNSKSTLDIAIDTALESMAGCLLTLDQLERAVRTQPVMMDQQTKLAVVRKQVNRRFTQLPEVRMMDGTAPAITLPAEYRGALALKNDPVPARYFGSEDVSAVALRVRNQESWGGREVLKNGDPYLMREAG